MLKKNVAKAIRSISPHGRAPIALLVMGIFLATATGVALAQDSSDQAGDSAATNGADQTTTADETTTSSTTSTEETTSEETTSTEETTTSEDAALAAETTTTSDALNIASVDTRAVTTGHNGKVECDPKATSEDNKISPQPGQTQELTVETVTLTFTFNDDGGEVTSGTWTSSAPFTGQIIVKSGNDTVVTEHQSESSGTITTPSKGISHVEGCAGVATTTTTTAVREEVSGNKKKGGGSRGKKGAVEEAPSGVAAEAAATRGDELPFTGLHAPLLVLIGLGTAVLGFTLRRRLQDLG